MNGSSGIAVGMATNIPRTDTEVIDGCLVINNPDCGIADLLKHIKGPDFPDRSNHSRKIWNY